MGRFPQAPSLTRKHSRIEPKIKIYVLCEGEVTEPQYLYQFSAQHINELVKVCPIPGVGVPLTVVNKAIELKTDLLKIARQKGDSFRKAFSVWCLVDVDEHPNLEAAKHLALTKNIHLCISNPCFELWGLLHLQHQDAYIDRHKLQSALHEIMPKYHHDSSPTLDFDLIKDKYTCARERAIEICARRKDEGKEGCNPSTNVHNLLDCIISNGKKAVREIKNSCDK